VLLFLAGWLAISVPASAQKAARSHSENPVGQHIFASSCASCHGLDGRGGERAPNIATRPEIQHLTDAALAGIIQSGVPGAGMPAFHSLSAAEIKAVVAYLRVLQGATQSVATTGDSVRGKELFFGRAGCAACHMVSGSGGFIAADLTGFAQTYSATEIRMAITQPNPRPDRPSVMVTTNNGVKYFGRIRNEDNFSLQLQTSDGAFHFLAKAEVERVEPDAQAEMPNTYGSTLTSMELDDLISYLILSSKKAESPPKRNEE
jgi:cytochrome c oxidase cbb3-type subunit 3